MPQLPQILENQTPQDSGPATTPVVTPQGDAVSKAMAGLGQEIQKTGATIFEIKDRRDKYNYSMARSSFYRQVADLENSVKDDPDYTSMSVKYQQGVKDIKGKLLESLGDNRFSNIFSENIDKISAQQIGQINQLAAKKQQATSVAGALDSANKSLDTYIKTPNPVIRDGLVVSAVEDYANAIPDSNPEKPLLVEKYKLEVGNKFASARLNSLDPNQQISLLEQEKRKSGSNFTSLIHPDDRVELMQRAIVAQRQQKSQAVTDLRNADFLKDRQAKENSLNVILKGGTANDIPLNQWARLNEEDRNNLNKIQRINNGLEQRDPIQGDRAYYDYRDMYQKDPESFAKLDPLTIQANVNPSKVKEVSDWQEKARAGINAPVDIVKYDQIANKTLNSIGVKPSSDQAVTFKNRLTEEVDYFKTVHKKDPSASDLQNMADGLVVKGSFKGALYGTNDKRIFQIPRKNVEKDIAVPDDWANELLSQNKKAGGKPLSESDIKQAYLNKLRNEK